MKKILKNKKLIIVLAILLIAIILIISTTTLITRVNTKKQKEELSNFSWEAQSFVLNDDYTYTFNVLVIVSELDGIQTIKYEKNGKEIVLTCNR